MGALSERLAQAVEFLKRNGYAKTNADVARALGVTNSAMSMAVNGSREPTWEMLLDFCDVYPIDIRWLRSGAGSMVRGGTELILLKRIEELELMVKQLKE